MKCLIITVAGMSTRFSESIGRELVKCIYYEEKVTECILYRLIANDYSYFDKIILVGGYRYNELEGFVIKHFDNMSEKIVMIYNEHYSDYGSGYSLLMGLKRAFEMGSDEIVFSEGDLFVQKEDFIKVSECKKDVITTNKEVILASKTVAFYTDIADKIHYIFDSNHGQLIINEPFTSIRNSGQIWKFTDLSRLKDICDGLNDTEKHGTNLVLIQKYFSGMTKEKIEMINFKDWLNCNTVYDFRMIKEIEVFNENNK